MIVDFIIMIYDNENEGYSFECQDYSAAKSIGKLRI